MRAAADAAAWRDWETGLYSIVVAVKVACVGWVVEGGRVVPGITAWPCASALAVVDDFGDLVVVGALS